MAKKLAVVLMNLGGPLKKSDIQPFLFNFFMDKNIIALPYFFRRILAGYIANKRSKGEALETYKKLGYKSPLLENTEKQAKALESAINDNIDSLEKFDLVKVFISMRYWHPMSEETVKNIRDYNPDHVVLLPLYPQYSTATSKSSIENWIKTAKNMELNCSTSIVCCYPFEDGFINASAKKIAKMYEQAKKQNPKIKYRVLFSAHGLPEKTIASGDPYQWQCEQSAKKIVKQMNIGALDWQICYQSRVGPLSWIGPSTKEALEQAAKDDVGVIIYPHSFVSEHVETLVEIEQEYKKLAEKLGVLDFIRVKTVGTDSDFIEGLCNSIYFVLDQHPESSLCCGYSKENICQKQYKQCAYNILKELL